MTGFLGADTEALRDVADLFERRGRRLREIRESIDVMVLREDVWVGTDAEGFRDRWSGVGAQLSEAAEATGRRRAELEEQAEEQDEVSEADDGAGGWFDAIGDFFGSIGDAALDLGKAGLKLFKGFTAFRLFSDLGQLTEAGFDGLRTLINQSYIDELVDLTRRPGQLIQDFLSSKGLSRIADVAGGIFDSGIVKGAGKFLGKALPILDIGTGIYQMATAEDGWDVASGGLSTLSGALLLAAPFTGPAAPIVAGVGAVAGGVSLAIDAGKAIVENWDTISETAGAAWDATTTYVSDTWNSATEAAGEAWDAATGAVGDFFSDPLGSIFG
ncbi:hypothetical protein ACXET9_08480 [Brachybacterium sp. DNPG3]